MEYIKGKTAVVTGISKGIGQAVVKALLEAGAYVVGWGISEPDYHHERLRWVECDVRDEGAVNRALAETLAWRPGVDFLVNNAGFGYFSPIGSFDSEQFRRMFEVNVYGTFYVAKAVAPLLVAQGSGHILNVSSIAGRVGAAQGEGYNATKWAVSGMSECLFHELRGAGVKVTTVYPGSTATHFFDAIPSGSAGPMMLDAAEVAGMMVHVMNTSANFLVRELEVRPLRSK